MPKRKQNSEDEPVYPIKNFKCGLNRLIRHPESNQENPWIRPAINDLVKNVSSMMFLGMNLAKSYLLKSFNDPNRFALPPLVSGLYDKFFLRCMETVCGNRQIKIQTAYYNSRQIKDKEGNVKPKKTVLRDVAYQEHLQSVADDFLTEIKKTGYELPIYKSCFIHSMDLMARQLWTTTNTHICQNFASWLKYYYIAITPWIQFLEPKKAKDKRHIRMLANRMSIYVRGFETSSSSTIKNTTEPWLSEPLKQFAIPMKQRLEPYYWVSIDEETGKRKVVGLTSQSIKKNFLSFLQLDYDLLTFCESKMKNLGKQEFTKPNFKLWSLIPNKEAHLSHIHIDTSSFGYLYYAYNSSKKTLSNSLKPEVWNQIYPNDALRKSRLTWRFDNLITTDGLSVSVKFRKIRHVCELTTNFEEKQPTSNERKKFKSPKSIQPAWIQKAKPELDTIHNRSKLVFGVDPGRNYAMTICALHPETGEISRTRILPRQYNLMLNTYGKQDRLSKLCGFAQTTPPDTTSFKTNDPVQLIQYISVRCKQVVEHPEGYSSDVYRKNKWDTFINKPRIVNNFINHTLLQVGYPVKQRTKNKKKDS